MGVSHRNALEFGVTTKPAVSLIPSVDDPSILPEGRGGTISKLYCTVVKLLYAGSKVPLKVVSKGSLARI